MRTTRTRLLFPLGAAAVAGVGLLAAPACAAPPDAPMPTTMAAPDKVYPPLPTLAMLPPGGGEIEPVVRTRGGKHKAAVGAPVRKAAEPTPRMVVSEASHTYLAGIEHQLEAALQK